MLWSYGRWSSERRRAQHGHKVSPIGYGSIPINTIFSGMNIHLPAILRFTRGTRFWHTANSLSVVNMYWFLVITVLCRLSGFSSAWGLWSWSSLGGFDVWSSPWQCQTEMVPPFERSIGLHCLADRLEYWYRRLTLNMSIFICLRTCYTCWSYPFTGEIPMISVLGVPKFSVNGAASIRWLTPHISPFSELLHGKLNCVGYPDIWSTEARVSGKMSQQNQSNTSEMNPIPPPSTNHSTQEQHGYCWLPRWSHRFSERQQFQGMARMERHQGLGVESNWRNQHLAIPRLRVSGSQGFHSYQTNWVTNEWTDPGRLNSWTPGRNEDPFPQGTIVLVLPRMAE